MRRRTRAKRGRCYFAEKCQLAGLARWFARALFSNTREIVLIRDARDTVCSYRSFWSQPTTEAIRLLRLSCDALMAVHNEQRPDTLFVRYEDMVARETESLATGRQLSRGSAISRPPDSDAEQALFREHGTSKSPDSFDRALEARSVGRGSKSLHARVHALPGDVRLRRVTPDRDLIPRGFGRTGRA